MSIEFIDVSLERDGRAILSRVSFSTRDIPIFMLFGPSGSGKTSLLRLANRLDEADAGDVYIHGRSVRDHVPSDLRRRVGMIFQEPRLLDGTAEENIRFGADYHGISVNLEELLDWVGLSGYGRRDVRDLSGGEKQRVALARALAVQPQILLLDEPTASLDRRAVRQVEDLLLQFVERQHLRMIFVTHDIAQVNRLGGTGAVLSAGTIVHQGDIVPYVEAGHV